MKKLRLGMQLFAVLLFILPAVALIILLAPAAGIGFAVISLVMTWLALSEGKRRIFFLYAIPGACLVVSGLLYLHVTYIADANGIFGTAFESLFAVILLGYGISIGLGAVLAHGARPTSRPADKTIGDG